MAALLALSAAAAYGVADFLGGIATRREPATAVVLWSHVVGLAIMLVAAPLVGGDLTMHSLGVGAAAGLVGGIGVAVFYRALSLGSMSVVAPIAALLSAGVPVVVGIGGGDRPEVAALVGIAVALVAIGLVSRERPDGHADLTLTRSLRWKVLALGFAAGLAFGLFFVTLDEAADGTGIWPLVGARITSVALFGSLGVAGLATASIPRTALVAAIGAGALDATANAFYLVALSHGMLSLVAVLTALYPAGTVMLARWVLGERMSGVQHTGLAFAAAAAVLIAL